MESGTRPPRVDAHVHLSRWWPDIQRTGYRPDLAYDVPGLLGEMDRAGVDLAVAIQLFQAPGEAAAVREGRSTYEASGGRLLPVATIDPTRGKESVEATVRLLAQEPRLVGLKLFPGYRSFYPNDRRLAPVYELAARRHLPVLVHQGDTLDGLGLLKFARPLEIDEVAASYREVRYVLCHLGNPWIDETAEMIYKNPNVYTDTSGLLGPPTSPFFRRAFKVARTRLETAIVTTGLPERFLFGSDWPLESLGTAGELVEGLDLTADERAGILGGNAAKLFGLATVPLPAKGTRPRPPLPRPSRGGAPSSRPRRRGSRTDPVL